MGAEVMAGAPAPPRRQRREAVERRDVEGWT